MVEPCCKQLQNTDVQTGISAILRDAPLYRRQWVKLKHVPTCCNIPYLDAINDVFLAIFLFSWQDFLPLVVNGLIGELTDGPKLKNSVPFAFQQNLPNSTYKGYTYILAIGNW